MRLPLTLIKMVGFSMLGNLSMLIFSSFFFWGGASKLLLRMMQRAQGHLLHAVPLLFLMSGLFALDILLVVSCAGKVSANTILCQIRDTKYHVSFSAIRVRCVVKVRNAASGAQPVYVACAGQGCQGDAAFLFAVR